MDRGLQDKTLEMFRNTWPSLDSVACKTAFDLWLTNKTPPRNYDRAFLGFAKKWAAGKT
jgi:hypothetical protein